MNILVTGASSGIGRAICETLVREGHQVIGTARAPERHTTDFQLLPLELTKWETIEALVKKIEKTGFEPDVLINNAGMGGVGAAEETPVDLARKQLEVNFWGGVFLTQKLLPRMRQKKSGKIIFISSLAGLVGVPFHGFYAASKHALEGYCKSLRLELSALGISVSVVQPGYVKTNIVNAFEHSDTTIKEYNKNRSQFISVFFENLNRAPGPQKVSKVVAKIIKSKSPKFHYKVGREVKLLNTLQFLSYPIFERGMLRNFKMD